MNLTETIRKMKDVELDEAVEVGGGATGTSKVAEPTGTEIGAPVLATAIPRRKPSLGPSAMVRTTPSPSCCCTSKVKPFSANADDSSVRRSAS